MDIKQAASQQLIDELILRNESIKIIEHGITTYINFNCEKHRTDGPAIEAGRLKKWYQNGKLHREDGPAMIMFESEFWYKDGKRHREDGPAIIYGDGEKQWWLNGIKVTEQDVLKKDKS